MTYRYNDGGRSEAGFKGESDCGIRAVSIACDMTYKAARKLLQEHARKGKQGNGTISAGIYREDMDAALSSIGWVWVSAPKLTGRKARYHDLPATGIHIARMAKHYAAVVHGDLYDAWNSSEKMVYGYWTKLNKR